MTLMNLRMKLENDKSLKFTQLTLSKKLKTIKTYFLTAVRMCEDLNEESKLNRNDLETSTNNNTYLSN